jgi:hypothetical protein
MPTGLPPHSQRRAGIVRAYVTNQIDRNAAWLAQTRFVRLECGKQDLPHFLDTATAHQIEYLEGILGL